MWEDYAGNCLLLQMCNMTGIHLAHLFHLLFLVIKRVLFIHIERYHQQISVAVVVKYTHFFNTQVTARLDYKQNSCSGPSKSEVCQFTTHIWLHIF